MRDIAILGAGPYGLSLAARLGRRDADMRVFGHPMRSWSAHMPRGMRLKSEGFASTLYDGTGAYSFAHYCRERGIAYADVGLPVTAADFAAYGTAFQRRFVPQLEETHAVRLRRHRDGFLLTLADGEEAAFRRVVLAVGIQPFAWTPPLFDALPSDHVSHSAAHHDMRRFAGQTVAVIGDGSSASDCAAALLDARATVHVITRGNALRFHAPPQPRSTYERLRWPLTTIGTGWPSVFYTRTPHLFRLLPQPLRHTITRRHLGPVGCWFTRDAVERGATIHAATEVHHAAIEAGRVTLALAGAGSGSKRLIADHVITATGYRVDLGRLSFLDGDLRAGIATAGGTPILSRHFESSVPGLFFMGVTAANMFGPLLRFACGADYAAGRLARHLDRGQRTVSQIGRDGRHGPTRSAPDQSEEVLAG